jgi:hypothetical protein
MMKNSFIIGRIVSKIGEIPVVSTKLDNADILGAVMVRWSINRSNYRVDPGVYAVGNPDKWSDVFVTGNYKLSFDALRKNLDGLNAWILVIDTKGVNVWCAAGKGTFGTRELVFKVNAFKLDEIVEHRRLILPQLGAVGVAAHDVKTFTGFTVIYGPVRAEDIQDFIAAGYKADKEMRKVKFNMKDRVKQIPVDFIYGKYYLLAAFAVMMVISGFSKTGYDFALLPKNGLYAVLNIFLAYSSGIVFTPIFLPYIPFRSFALKGLFTGIVMSVLLFFANFLGNGIIEIISWFLIISTVSSFIAMNFTGSSTYTSLSGVKKEMRIAIPIQIIVMVIGIAGLILSKFI